MGRAVLLVRPLGSATGNLREASLDAVTVGVTAVAGSLDGTLDLGDGPITSAGLSDLFVMRIE